MLKPNSELSTTQQSLILRTREMPAAVGLKTVIDAITKAVASLEMMGYAAPEGSEFRACIEDTLGAIKGLTLNQLDPLIEKVVSGIDPHDPTSFGKLKDMK